MTVFGKMYVGGDVPDHDLDPPDTGDYWDMRDPDDADEVEL